MISKLSNCLSETLYKRNVILFEEIELYEYSLFMILSYLSFLIIAIILGFVLKIPFLAMIFYIVFSLIRNFAGGIHANSEVKCNIITTMLILISEVLIKVLISYDLIWIPLVMLLISSVSLIVLKPVASSQKEISQKERLHFHKKVIVLTVIAVLISLSCLLLDIRSITISLSVGLFLATILLIIGKIQVVYLKTKSS